MTDLPHLFGGAVGFLTGWIWDFYPVLHLSRANNVQRRNWWSSCMAYSLCHCIFSIQGPFVWASPKCSCLYKDLFQSDRVVTSIQFCVEHSSSTSRWETCSDICSEASPVSSELMENATGCLPVTINHDFLPAFQGIKSVRILINWGRSYYNGRNLCAF